MERRADLRKRTRYYPGVAAHLFAGWMQVRVGASEAGSVVSVNLGSRGADSFEPVKGQSLAPVAGP